MLIRAQWVRWFRDLLITKLSTLGLNIINDLEEWRPCGPLDGVPWIFEVDEAARAMSNRKAVGPDGLAIELLKTPTVEGFDESETLRKFCETVVTV